MHSRIFALRLLTGEEPRSYEVADDRTVPFSWCEAWADYISTINRHKWEENAEWLCSSFDSFLTISVDADGEIVVSVCASALRSWLDSKFNRLKEYLDRHSVDDFISNYGFEIREILDHSDFHVIDTTGTSSVDEACVSTVEEFFLNVAHMCHPDSWQYQSHSAFRKDIIRYRLEGVLDYHC